MIPVSTIWRPWPRIWREGTRADCLQIARAVYEMAGGAPMIDLGAGAATLTDGFEGVFVDVAPRCQPMMPDSLIVTADLRRAHEIPDLQDIPFNLLVMTDVIEHLTKEDGIAVLRNMAPRCKAGLIFTPTGELWLDPDAPADDPHAHRSGWTPEEFHNSGWGVIEFPTFHRFPADHERSPGAIRGAFFAFALPSNPTPEDVLKRACVTE